MNESGKEKWEKELGGILSLYTPVISASIEYKKNGFAVILFDRKVLSFSRRFRRIENAKEYAITQMKERVYQSLQILEQSSQNQENTDD